MAVWCKPILGRDSRYNISFLLQRNIERIFRYHSTAPPCPTEQGGKVSEVSILEAPHRVPERPKVVVHNGTATAEAQASSVRTTDCTAPVVAVRPDTAERPIVVAAARDWQF